MAHLCEPKRRWQQEKDIGVQFGLRSYLRFYEMTQGSAKSKSYTDFVTSPYYSAFVKFGQYIVQIRAVSPNQFIDWVIKQNKKLDLWTKDKIYEEYLSEYMKKEAPSDALERSFIEMQRWADESDKSFNELFVKGSPNKVCAMIVNGRLSPWILYNCDNGIEFLSGLNSEQIASIYPYINPEVWQKKFSTYLADTEFIKDALRIAQV